MRGLKDAVDILVGSCDSMVCYFPVGANKRATFVKLVIWSGVAPVAEQVLVGWGLIVICGTAKFGRIR